MCQVKSSTFFANLFRQTPLKKNIISLVPCSLRDPIKRQMGFCILRPDRPAPLSLFLAANLPRDFLVNFLETCDAKNTDVVLSGLTSKGTKYDLDWNHNLCCLVDICTERRILVRKIKPEEYRPFFTRNRPPTDQNLKLAMKEFGASYYTPEFLYLLGYKNLIQAFALAKYHQYLLGCEACTSTLIGQAKNR